MKTAPHLNSAPTSPMADATATAPVATVRTVSIAGRTIVIECRVDGVVLVNGDVVEPAQVTLERFRADRQQP
jgi:hypothetical protein